MSGFPGYFQDLKALKISSKAFKEATGYTINIGGYKDNSKYTGSALRTIRYNQAREALDAHYAAGGEKIDESRCIDLQADI